MKFKIGFLLIFLTTFLCGYFLVFNNKKVEKEVIIANAQIQQTPSISTKKADFVEQIQEEKVEWKEEDSDKLKIKLLETGDGYHGDQVNAKNGEEWLGLFKQNENYFLRKTKLKIKRVEDVVVDGDSNNKTGKSVITDVKAKSVVLLKNSKLSEGEINTIYFADEEDESRYIKNNTERNFEFSGEKYFLKVENVLNKEEFLTKGSKLVLSKNGTEQILSYLKDGCNDCFWELYWVGDLDRDGKLDFYFDLSWHYNVIDRKLFLSSKAEKGKLVKYVANFWTNGC